MKIGILTSGGDCPGLNAVIRGAVLKGDRVHHSEFAGFRYGWRGVVEGDIMPLDSQRVQVAAGACNRSGISRWLRHPARPPPVKRGQGLPPA